MAQILAPHHLSVRSYESAKKSDQNMEMYMTIAHVFWAEDEFLVALSSGTERKVIRNIFLDYIHVHLSFRPQTEKYGQLQKPKNPCTHMYMYPVYGCMLNGGGQTLLMSYWAFCAILTLIDTTVKRIPRATKIRPAMTNTTKMCLAEKTGRQAGICCCSHLLPAVKNERVRRIHVQCTWSAKKL